MNTDLQAITDQMVGVFSSVKTGGLQIVGGAITLGLIFVGAKWLWGKTRQWMAKA